MEMCLKLYVIPSANSDIEILQLEGELKEERR